MKTPDLESTKAERAQAVEARFALRLTAHLGMAAEELPHDISERLRHARERAVAAARTAQRTSQVTAPTLVHAGGAAVLGGPPSLWLRLVSIMPLIVLIVGLVLIQNYHEQEQINVAAEVDTALLADELPPAAYRDPGFIAFLQSQGDQ